MKFYCQNCSGKRYKTSWSSEEYYVHTFLGEVIGSQFIYDPPSKCKICKTKTKFVVGLDVELQPEKNEVIVYIDMHN